MTPSQLKRSENDKDTKQINHKYACVTVIPSLQVNFQLGMTLCNPSVIPNTIDPTRFYYAPPSRPLIKGQTIKIVASLSLHSNNHTVHKGQGSFDNTLMWLDSHLDDSRFELV
jgi:hypothetical protein